MQKWSVGTGLTQQQLADYIMESNATINLFESGLRTMPIAAQQTIFATLPPGKSKDNAELSIEILEARKKD
jgi:transcriptional regulator with XRE-family HTH domain